MNTMIRLNIMHEDSVASLDFAIPDDVTEDQHDVFAAGAMAGVIAYIQFLGGIPIEENGKVEEHKHKMSLVRAVGISPQDVFWICSFENCLANYSIPKMLLRQMMLYS